MLRRASDRLFRLVDGSALALCRIVFAVVMFVDICHQWRHLSKAGDFLRFEFRPVYSFTPFLVGWTTPNPDVVCPIMLVALAALGLGLLTRISAFVFGTVFAYLEVLDPSRFNNHTYLIALLAFWLVIVRSNADWSIDSLLWRRGDSPGRVPFWHQAVLRFQLCVVYFYGGLAKLNSDWLSGEPIVAWVRDAPNAEEFQAHFLAPTLQWAATGYFVAYFGIVFDLAIPFLLLWRRSRPFAFLLTVGFHLANTQLFRIGVFPWLGIGSLVLFLEPNSPRRWFARWFGGSPEVAPTETETLAPSSGRRRLATALLVTYAAWQLLVPFRHVLYPGWVEWNYAGKAFSWRMMLSHKQTFVGMQVVDRRTRSLYEVDMGGTAFAVVDAEPGKSVLRLVDGKPMLLPSRLLRDTQIRSKGVWGNPVLLAQYAHYIADEARALGMRDPIVRVDAVQSLNGRPFQYIVDPQIDLGAARIPALGTPTWVLPLEPDQPTGDYVDSLQDMHDRVMAVIRARQDRVTRWLLTITQPKR